MEIELKPYTVPELCIIVGVNNPQYLRDWIAENRTRLGIGPKHKKKYVPTDVEKIIKGFGVAKKIKT